MSNLGQTEWALEHFSDFSTIALGMYENHKNQMTNIITNPQIDQIETFAISPYVITILQFSKWIDTFIFL